MAKVTMPQLGESVAEGTIGKWLKQPGDQVAKYEPLLEVITDKVNAEVPSPFEGVLKEILAEEGATVPNNAEIAVIETAGEDGVAAGAASATPPVGTAAAAESEPTTAPAEPQPAGTPADAPDDAGASEKQADPSEPDTGGPGADLAAGDHGPAGSDERAATSDPGATTEIAAPAAGTEAPPATGPTAGLAVGGAPSLQAAASGSSPGSTAPTNGEGNPDARMTPAVRRLLREHGLTAAQIAGTGGGGRITRDDVINFVEAQRTGQPVNGQSGATATAAPAPAPAAPATSPAPAAQPAQSTPTPAAPAPTSVQPAAPAAPATSTAASGGTRIEFPAGADEVMVPMTQMRKGISAQMTRALQAPHAYVQMEIDATRLVAFREKAKREYQAKEGIGLSYVPFVVKASAEALKRNPTFNAHWTENGLLAKRRVNIGVAVAVDEGLLVPVIRDADTLSIHGLNRAIADVAARAKAGKFKLDDFGGGTFTVDNTGYLGTNLVMPILNVPEVGIVTMEAITKRPVVVSTPDGDVIAIRPVMNMVLGIDHRANDGAGGAALLRDIKASLESVGPETPIY